MEITIYSDYNYGDILHHLNEDVKVVAVKFENKSFRYLLERQDLTRYWAKEREID